MSHSKDLDIIIKSPLDIREYKALELSNGLKVILISTLKLAALKSKGPKKNSTCHLKKVFRFNKQYLGLDNDDIKVRCECPTQAPNVLNKSTSTDTGLGSAVSSKDEMPLTFSEAMKAIKELIYGSTTDIPHPDTNESKTSTEDSLEESEEEDSSQVASAYLTIGAGWFNDPEDMAGMAHYTEHASFLGSKKFPAPNQLFRLIIPHDGYVNAYTSGTSTVFTVSTSLEIYHVALEMLGDMIGFPLLPFELVSKEIEAIDSEFSLRQDDIPKYLQLLASLAKEGHPLRKMDSGNRETLKVPNFHRKLIDWRNSHYCANYMTLTLEAPLPLEKLEKYAVKYFSEIPSSNLPSPRARIHRKGFPFNMSLFHRIYHIPSVYHSEFMAIHWAFEPTAWKNLSSKPLDYIANLLSHKGEGGLYHFLNCFGWATNVNAGCWESDVTMNQYTSLFSVCIDMTEEGFKKQDYILEAVFGYFDMLSQNAPFKSFFQETQRQQADDFHNHALRTTSSFAEKTSQWLQIVPPKFVLIAPQLTSSFDSKLISECLSQLRVDSCNVMVFSQKFKKKEKMSSMEKFYKTPYASYDWPLGLSEKVKRLKSQISQLFSLPRLNLYLQELTCSGKQQKNMIRKGPLMVVKGKVALYYKDDDFRTVGGQLPQSKYAFWFHSTPNDTERNIFAKLHLFVNIFNDMIDSKFVAALSANHQIQAFVSHGRFKLILIGPSNQLPQVIKEIFKIFTVFENLIDKRTFRVGKRLYVETLDNVVLDNRWYAWDLMNYLWSSHHELSEQHKKDAENLDYQDFVDFIKTFKKSIYIVGHLFGYLTTDEAFSVVQTVSLFMKNYSQQVNHHQIPLHQCPQFPVGESIVKITSKNARIHTSVVINGYQFGNLSKKDNDIVVFLAATMSDSAYTALRTTEQLGYVVIVYHDVSYTVSSLLIELVTQPKNYTTDYCNIRIDQFIIDFFNAHLVTQEKFTEFLKGKPKVDFSHEDIKTLYQEYLMPNSTNYRKISIQVIGSVVDAFALCEASNVMKMPDIYLPDGNENVGLDPTGPFKSKQKPIENRITKNKGLEYSKSKPEVFKHSKSENFKPDIRKARSKATCNSKSCRFVSDIQRHEQSISKNRHESPSHSSLLTRKVSDIHKFKNKLRLYPNLDAAKIVINEDES